MHLISEFMNRHHRHCDDVLTRAAECAAAEDWAGLERDFATFLRAIELHIEAEENLLFPAFEERTGMTSGPTSVMRMEHGEMRELFAGMRAAVEGKDGKRYRDLSQNLFALLGEHNMKEERMLYPMMDTSLGSKAESLLAQMGSLAV